MFRFKYLLFFITLVAIKLSAQSISFYPEMVVGNRSTSYQHIIGFKINDTWSFNNVSLLDTDHIIDKNNIFFIRNMVSFNLNKHFKTNAAIGIKNPGKFATIASQFQHITSNFKIIYSVGCTYQNSFTLEQTLLMNYSPNLNKNLRAYMNLFVVVNTNLKELDRGIQQFRLGVKKERFITGIAANLDQFTKAEKTLENFGVFIKYNF